MTDCLVEMGLIVLAEIIHLYRVTILDSNLGLRCSGSLFAAIVAISRQDGGTSKIYVNMRFLPARMVTLYAWTARLAKQLQHTIH